MKEREVDIVTSDDEIFENLGDLGALEPAVKLNGR